ncbi:solute carrier family 22 member 4-like [Plakobranchus ocellatus]|uniref:Solute carrier family 22 member 4-like n=1 Tax=Plakobranchus ocellatus TaxID=259542 RepID=A0AAV4AZN0_9GAST|nr:solute carrier family 22 member 4-like [Plakobranchus ocellatus]
MPHSSNFIYSPVGQSHSSQKMTTIEDIYDRIGGMGKFQIMAIVLLYGTMAIWHLVCDRLWLKATITSAQMFGVMLGSVLSGLSGDYFGRKKSTYVALFLQAGLNVIAVFSSTWQMFIAFRFLIGITIGQGLVMIVPYPTEFLPKRWRHILPLMPLWPLGVMIMAATAWWLEDWSHLHIACAVITFVFTLGCFYVPESPRWLATQGKVDESYSALEKIARVNKKRLPPGVTEILLFSREQVSVLYKVKIVCPVVDRLGRRLACVILMGIVVLTSFICVVLCVSASEHTRDVWISRLGHVSALFVATCWGASKLWVAESYPTVTRSLGYAFANFSSRVGGVLAPFLLNLDERLLFSYIMMGAMTLASMVSILFIPETHNRALLETVNEEELCVTKEQTGNIHKQCVGAADDKAGMRNGEHSESLDVDSMSRMVGRDQSV